jgi:hypothetical protein
VTAPAEPGFTAREVYAWVCRDDRGDEGPLSAPIVEGRYVCLIGPTREAAEQFRQTAEAIAGALRRPVALVRFSRREVLDEVGPGARAVL